MTLRMQIVILLLTVGLAACSPTAEVSPADAADETAQTTQDEMMNQSGGIGMGMGPGSGMMERHRAPIPAEYKGLVNPVSADEASLKRGGDIYAQYCVNCHGDGGMGDGPAGQQLDPQPAPIAHTSRMLGDDYLFWRISEGGSHEPFSSAMPRWQDLLDNNARWDVINYVRALGSGQVTPGQQMGGAAFDPEAEAAKHAEMAAAGVEQGLFTQSEADTFISVHEQLDKLIVAGMEGQSGSMATMQDTMLAQLLEEGLISGEELSTFNSVHESLLAAGLME